MTTWTVTMRTGRSTWSTLDVEAANHAAAARIARRLVGGTFVSIT